MKTIENLKADVSIMSGLSIESLTNIEAIAEYYMCWINSQINTNQFSFDSIGEGNTELPIDLYLNVLVPIVSKHYFDKEALNKAISEPVERIKEGDSEVWLNKDKPTLHLNSDFKRALSKYKKLISI